MPWRDITTQPFVRDLLQRSIHHERTHHGYIFTGEESETKLIALSFAQALNCEKHAEDFCGSCDSCLAIVKGQHPDIYAIHPESKSRRILINQVRELEKSVYLKASRAKTKLAVIYEADRLQMEAQDAFLKTLEEPPPKTVFLLLTEEPQRLKDTILSRCLKIPFRPSQRKQKTEREKLVEKWLTDFVSTIVSPSETALFYAYGLIGKVLELLKEVRDEKLERGKLLLENPALENLTAAQHERLKEQIEAQAQADYLYERTRLLRVMVEWCYTNQIHRDAIEILEKLARRLAGNIHEALAWEVAVLELMGVFSPESKLAR